MTDTETPKPPAQHEHLNVNAERDARENIGDLTRIMLRHARTYDDQLCVNQMIAKMWADGMTPSYVEGTLAMTLVDGLRDGNWPWKISQPASKLQQLSESHGD